MYKLKQDVPYLVVKYLQILEHIIAKLLQIVAVRRRVKEAFEKWAISKGVNTECFK